MKPRVRHITAFIVLVSMLMTTAFPFRAYGEAQFDGTQSSWAEAELKEAFGLELTYPDVMNNFKKNITREEFCTLAVKLYEKLTGKTAASSNDPFKDTDNKEILKAYELGIVKGTSSDTFSPANNITRQEICVMINRALKAGFPNLETGTSAEFPFKDAPRIASWAIDAMKFAYVNEIMKGVSSDNIDPLSNTTREQAIILLLRTYKKFTTTGTQSTVRIVPGQSPIKNIKKKFEFTVNANNIFFPKFDERIELFVASKAGKPTSMPAFSASREGEYKIFAALSNTITVPDVKLPEIQTPTISRPQIEMPDIEIKYQPPIKERPDYAVYTKSDYGAFIDKNGDRVRWFAFNLNNAQGTSKVLWQVSSVPFSGFKSGFKTQPGIVMSGEVSASAKEFSVDFGKISDVNAWSRVVSTDNYRPITQIQKTYYVRAFPVDAQGNPIGDPGKGLALLYGDTVPAYSEVVEAFELWTPKSVMGSYGAENNDEPRHDPWSNGNQVGVDPKSTTSRLFHFHGFEEDAKKIAIQVFNDKFDADQPYTNKTNVVYEKVYTLPVSTSGLPTTEYVPSVLVPFAEFGKNPSEMAEEQYIKYFVRGIAISESEQPGKEEISYSDVVTISYGFGKPVNIIAPPPKYTKTEKIGLSMPSIRIAGYEAVQWADPEYLSHYYVYRKPEPQEITCNWKNVDSGEVLKPYFMAMNPLYGDSMTEEEYRKAIDRVLPVGTLVYIPKPVEKDNSWYQELYEGVVGFFEDVISTVANIYSKIQQTYDNLKTKLVEAVADLCPVPSLRGYFAAALEGLISYGLASMGLPPKFPNFDKLASDNIGYLAQVALSEAGVPPNEITDELTEKVAGEMVKQMTESNKTSDENPVNAAFLKLDPNYLYKPACVELEIANNTDYPTVPGVIDLNVTFRLNQSGLYATSYDPVGLDLTNDTNQYGYDPYGYGAETAVQYRNHFVYGLNGYTVNYQLGDEAVYEVFTPAVNQKIPTIPPHTKQTMKIYMEPGGFASASRYPTTEGSRYEDFYNMYFNNGNKDYTWFEITQNFTSAEKYLTEKAAKEKTIFILDPKTDYEYMNEHTYGYSNGYNMQMPVNRNW